MQASLCSHIPLLCLKTLFEITSLLSLTPVHSTSPVFPIRHYILTGPWMVKETNVLGGSTMFNSKSSIFSLSAPVCMCGHWRARCYSDGRVEKSEVLLDVIMVLAGGPESPEEALASPTQNAGRVCQTNCLCLCKFTRWGQGWKPAAPIN